MNLREASFYLTGEAEGSDRKHQALFSAQYLRSGALCRSREENLFTTWQFLMKSFSQLEKSYLLYSLEY